MKLLLIGFHKYDDNMYPHLRCFIDEISNHCDLTYFHFRERGYTVDHIIKRPFTIRSWIDLCKAAIKSVIDLVKLRLIYGNYDRVIAIDHYTYALVSFIFRKMDVIFWSHDVIGFDHPAYYHPLVKSYMKLCSWALRKNKRIIIQDDERLHLLKKSLHLNDDSLDVFLMPVCLPQIRTKYRVLSSDTKPRIMQCGGIGAYRSSDKLLSHYQKNSSFYRLYFHGFLLPAIRTQLSECDIQPIVSTLTVKPKQIPQLLDYCDIGFVSYEDEEDMNFFLIARSSGQLVECIRVGLPVIVMGKNNLHKFVQEQCIGVGIKDISEINSAISTIVQKYDIYSQNCFRCFDRYFDSSNYIPQISNWI
jgi:hypothetical protein